MDPHGRPIFHSRGAGGPSFVVETVGQLRRAERFRSTKPTSGVITVSAVFGSMLTMQSSDDFARATGSVVLVLVAVLVFHSVRNGWRVINETAIPPSS